MNPYFVTAILFIAFLFVFLGYRMGLNDGINIQKGKEIKPISNPVTATYKAVTEIKDGSVQKKEEKEFIDQLNNLFGYDGTPQKKGDE